MFAQHPLWEVLVKLFQKFADFKDSVLGRATQSAKFLFCLGVGFSLLYYAFLNFKAVEFRLNSGFFILSFCRSVKESIKESAFERRQELPAGTGATPLCQPLKCGADYRDVTATLKMKRSRRIHPFCVLTESGPKALLMEISETFIGYLFCLYFRRNHLKRRNYYLRQKCSMPQAA